MLRPAYQNLRYCYKAREKKEDRRIVWNRADYRVKLQEDLEDIRQKLCQVSRKELDKKEATRPVNCMEEGVWSTSASRGLVRGGVVVTPRRKFINLIN